MTVTTQTPVERVTAFDMERACECGHGRRDHFPASDAMGTGEVCTGRCKLIACGCRAFRIPWVCNGPCKKRVEGPKLPSEWVELSVNGTTVGHFCPECSKSVDVPLILKAREVEKRFRHAIGAGDTEAQ